MAMTRSPDTRRGSRSSGPDDTTRRKLTARDVGVAGLIWYRPWQIRPST